MAYWVAGPLALVARDCRSEIMTSPPRQSPPEPMRRRLDASAGGGRPAYRQKPRRYHYVTPPKPRPLLARLAVLGIRAVGAAPLPLTQRLGAALGWLGAVLPTRERRVTDINLRIAFPDMTEAARRRLARRSMMHTGRTFAEIGAIWTWDRDRLLRRVQEVVGEHEVRQALDGGRGVLLAGPHLGSWELVGAYCSSRYPMTSLYRAPRIRELEPFFRQARARFGGSLVPAKTGAARELLRALRRGEVIGILPDQDSGAGAGIYVPFFGLPVNTMVLPSRLAAKSGAWVGFAFAERLPRSSGFRVHFVPASDGIYDPDVERSARTLNADIERLVRRLPEQYLWSYKRFRKPAPGLRDPYRTGWGAT